MSKLTPVLIRAFGRTGTTLLMQLLNSSDKVLVPNEYPFESRFLSYFAKVAQLVSGNRKESKYTDGDVLNSQAEYIGANPYELSSVVNPDTFNIRIAQALWNQFSVEVKLKGNFEFYAEKVSFEYADYINKNLPLVKNIFVVRDPRGELASIIAFNRKRGFNGFGWKDDDDIFSFSERMVGPRKRFFNELNNINNPNAIVLRFEDIVSDLFSSSRKISDFIGVELDPNFVLQSQSQFSHHMTSTSIKDSSDKWNKEIPKDVSDIFVREMSDELKVFGYSTN